MVRPRKVKEEGMTLLEMIITITVLLIVAFPLTSILTMGLIIPTQEQQRITDTGNAQLLASFFVNDVQSAAVVDTTGATACPGASGTVFSVSWVDQADPVTTVQKMVDYETSGNRLLRRACDSGGGPGDAPVAVLEFLQGSPTVGCTGKVCTLTATELGQRSDAKPYTVNLAASRRDS